MASSNDGSDNDNNYSDKNGNSDAEEDDEELELNGFLQLDPRPGSSKELYGKRSVTSNAGMTHGELDEDKKLAERLQAEEYDRRFAELLQEEEYGGPAVTPELLNSMIMRETNKKKGDKKDYTIRQSRVEYQESDDDSEAERGSTFEVLEADRIAELMNDRIDVANSVLHLPPTTTRMLLNHFSWDVDRLCELYFCGGNAGREQLFQNAEVLNPQVPESRVETNIVQVKGEKKEEDCEICYDRVSSSEMYGMRCDHRFCHKCWVQYITNQIQGDSWSQACIQCIGHTCKILVDDEAVMNFLTDPTVKLKYQHQITNSFVQHNRRMKWCPSPNCNNAIKIKFLDELDTSVECKCGHQFCFRCAADTHDPVSCEMLKSWLMKMKEATKEAASSRWIVQNTKDCPSCQSPIEKNGGCNHMHCTKCRKGFCWLCLGAWSDRHNCNNYEHSSGTGPRNQTLADLERHKFYIDRYTNHQNSLKLEIRLIKLAKHKVTEMVDYDMSYVEAQFLRKAVDTLCRCRRTLISTYVFAFFVTKTKDNCQIEIFEANQDDLHAATERLSGFLENEVFPCTDLKEKQQKIYDLFKYCESRRQALINHIYEGDKMGWWKMRN